MIRHVVRALAHLGIRAPFPIQSLVLPDAIAGRDILELGCGGAQWAIALAKADAVKVPAILFGAAFVFLQAAVGVLAVAIYLSLIPAIGPFFAGLVAFLVFAGAAGGFAWFGAAKLRERL